MSKFRLEIDIKGFNTLRNDPELQAWCDNTAEDIASTANAAIGEPDAFEAISSPHTSRARAVVVTATAAGKKAEAEDRILSMAFGSGGG